MLFRCRKHATWEAQTCHLEFLHAEKHCFASGVWAKQQQRLIETAAAFDRNSSGV